MRARHLSLRATSPNRPVGLVRVFLGVVFVTTGLMKLTLPTFGTAWSIQLTEAGIPLHSFNYWFVPIFEFLLGTSLLVGFLVWGIGLSLGGPTGYAINPARDLGPRLAHALLPLPRKGSSDWSYSWVPAVGPLVGGLLGAFAFTWLGA